MESGLGEPRGPLVHLWIAPLPPPPKVFAHPPIPRLVKTCLSLFHYLKFPLLEVNLYGDTVYFFYNENVSKEIKAILNHSNSKV